MYPVYDTPAEFFGPGFLVASNKVQFTTNTDAGVSWGTITVAGGNNGINATAHGALPGQPIMFSNSGGALPEPLLANTRYYVLSSSTVNLIEFSEVPGGTKINMTTAGTGTTTLLFPPLLANLSTAQAGVNTAQTLFALINLINNRFNSIPAADRPVKFSSRLFPSTDLTTGGLIYNFNITFAVNPETILASNS